MSEKLNQSAFVIMLGGRFYREIKNKRVITAWCIEGSKLFSHNSHLFGEKSPRNIEFVKSQLDARGKKYKIVPVKLQLQEKPVEKETTENLFICNGCNHLLDTVFIMKTPGYCYMCDPNVTLEELLSDEPIAETKKEYLFPTDILI